MTKVNANNKKKRSSTGQGSKRKAGRQKIRQKHATSSSDYWLYGIHAVRAALQNPKRRFLRLLTTAEALKRLGDLSAVQNTSNSRETVNRSDIDQILGPDRAHQGIALLTVPLRPHDLTDILDELSAADEPSLLIALDQVTDPHNVGAVLRSAAAFDAKAVITTRRNAPDETGALAKAASGAMETVPLVQVPNLKRALNTCQKNGFWSVGLDAQAATELRAVDLPKKCVLVFGSEGEGLRPGTHKECDFTARLPIADTIDSLNISSAAAISMYEWKRQRS